MGVAKIPIKFRQLTYFLKVVEVGSISKAAIKIGVAQPALSQNIADLENRFQVKLLTRSSRGVTPTLAGEKLVEHAQTILRQVNQAYLEIRYLNQTPRGEVVVALASASSIFFAAPLIMAVAKEYPDIKVKIIESMSFKTSELISHGHADLALIPNGHLLDGVDAETVMIEYLFFGGRADKNLKGDDPIDLKNVCKYPLIMPIRPHYARNTLEQAAFDNGYGLNIQVDQDSGRIIQCLLDAGLGYSVLPWPAFYANYVKGKFVVKKVINPELPRPLTIAWQKHKTLSDPIIIVRDKLRILVRTLHKKGILRGELKDTPTKILTATVS